MYAQELELQKERPLDTSVRLRKRTVNRIKAYGQGHQQSFDDILNRILDNYEKRGYEIPKDERSF